MLSVFKVLVSSWNNQTNIDLLQDIRDDFQSCLSINEFRHNSEKFHPYDQNGQWHMKRYLNMAEKRQPIYMNMTRALCSLTSKYSHQPAYICSLAKVFTVGTKY